MDKKKVYVCGKVGEKKFECEECTLMSPEWARVGKSGICFLCILLTDNEIDVIKRWKSEYA